MEILLKAQEFRIAKILFAAACLTACGATSEGTAPMAAENAGAAGSGGGSESGVDGGAAGAPPSQAESGAGGASATPDTERLDSCATSEPCAASTAQMVEGSRAPIQPEPALCLLRALRDRTPGRYFHELGHTHSSGAHGAEHVLLLGSEGDLLVARDTYLINTLGDDPPSSQSSLPGQRCRLKPASFFEDCIAALESSPRDEDRVWQCLAGEDETLTGALPWFEECREATPVQCDG